MDAHIEDKILNDLTQLTGIRYKFSGYHDSRSISGEVVSFVPENENAFSLEQRRLIHSLSKQELYLTADKSPKLIVDVDDLGKTHQLIKKALEAEASRITRLEEGQKLMNQLGAAFEFDDNRKLLVHPGVRDLKAERALFRNFDLDRPYERGLAMECNPADQKITLYDVDLEMLRKHVKLMERFTPRPLNRPGVAERSSGNREVN